MKTKIKLSQLMGMVILAGLIFSGVARGDGQKAPIVDKKAKRLKVEARVFTKSSEKAVSSTAAQDVFVDKNGDGINDLLDEKKDNKSVIKFLNDKGNRYFSSPKSANITTEKPVVEQAQTQPKIVESQPQTPKISVSESKPNVAEKVVKAKPNIKKPERINLAPKRK